jgi:hypothetical protein
MWLADPLLYKIQGCNYTVFHGIITKMEPNVQTCARIISPLTVVKASFKVGLEGVYDLYARLLVKRWMMNRGMNRGRGIGIDEAFFCDSCSNLEIDENFQISHKLGIDLAE